jgi:hypothetical protein
MMSLTALLCFLLDMSSGNMDDMVVRVRRMNLTVHMTCEREEKCVHGFAE